MAHGGENENIGCRDLLEQGTSGREMDTAMEVLRVIVITVPYSRNLESTWNVNKSRIFRGGCTKCSRVRFLN